MKEKYAINHQKRKKSVTTIDNFLGKLLHFRPNSHFHPSWFDNALLYNVCCIAVDSMPEADAYIKLAGDGDTEMGGEEEGTEEQTEGAEPMMTAEDDQQEETAAGQL